MHAIATDGPIILMNDAALDLPVGRQPMPDGALVFVAGRAPVRMALAELTLPGVRRVWTDFAQSASLAALHRRIQDAGGLDRLILAADGRQSEAMFSVMCTVLTFLPALRRRPGARVSLWVETGPAVAALRLFLSRIGPRLASDRIAVELNLRAPQLVRPALATRA